MRSAPVPKIQCIALLLCGLMGCGNSVARSDSVQVAAPTAIALSRIAELQKQPKRDLPVSIKGRIGHQAPIVGGTVYELQDSTGSIWVVSRKPVPSPNTEVVIQGILRYQSIRQNGKERGSLYIEQP